jgi:hypothetical protein
MPYMVGIVIMHAKRENVDIVFETIFIKWPLENKNYDCIFVYDSNYWFISQNK